MGDLYFFVMSKNNRIYLQIYKLYTTFVFGITTEYEDFIHI